ncbi:MAG: iron hydrogenase small subunit [Oscillospiraceae bacterium]|nr:iron hydrogenase small subunit [Oscillospiraceae bacterium]
MGLAHLEGGGAHLIGAAQAAVLDLLQGVAGLVGHAVADYSLGHAASGAENRSGAGQPHGLKRQKDIRAEGLYEVDRSSLIKSSERNPIIKEMYAGVLNGRNHELLHVHYGKK